MLLSQIRVHVVNQPSSVWFFLLLTRLFLEESFQMRLDSLTLFTITITITSLPQLHHLVTSGGGNSCDIAQINVVVSQTCNVLSYPNCYDCQAFCSVILEILEC